MAADDAPRVSELEALRIRNAELAAALAARRGGRVRATVGWSLLVAGCVFAVLAVVANWARREVVDTNRYVQTVAPLATQPAVQSLVTDQLTAAIADPARTAKLARDALPPKAAPLATPLATALQRFVHDKVGDFVRSDRFPALWDGLSRRTHAAALALLTGQNAGRVRVNGDKLVLQLGPVLPKVEQVLQRAGVDLSGQLPIQTGAGGPQLVLADASAIQTARGGLRLLKGVAIVLPVLALLCLACSIYVAAERRKGVVRAGVGLAVAMVVLGVALAIARSLYLDAVVSPELPQAAAAAFYDTILHFLRIALRVVLAAGLVVALGAVLAGPARPAVALRRALDSAGPRTVAAGVHLGRFGREVARHRHALEWTAAAAGALVLVSLSVPTGAAVLKLALGVLVVVALIEAIAGTAAAEIRTSPSTPTRPPPPTAT